MPPPLDQSERPWLQSAKRRGQIVDDFCKKHGVTALDVYVLVTRLEDERREELGRGAIRSER